jgi:hypothetical protein
MSLNGGDQLARGARSANFSMPEVSQDKWDACFGKRPLNISKPEKKNEPKRPSRKHS